MANSPSEQGAIDKANGRNPTPPKGDSAKSEYMGGYNGK